MSKRKEVALVSKNVRPGNNREDLGWRLSLIKRWRRERGLSLEIGEDCFGPGSGREDLGKGWGRFVGGRWSECSVSCFLGVTPGKVAGLPALRACAQLCGSLSHRMTPRERRVPVPQQYGSCGESQVPRRPQMTKEQTFHGSQ